MSFLRLGRKQSRSGSGAHGNINPLNGYMSSTGNDGEQMMEDARRAAQVAQLARQIYDNQNTGGSATQWSNNQNPGGPAQQWSNNPNQGGTSWPTNTNYTSRAMSPSRSQTGLQDQMSGGTFVSASSPQRRPVPNVPPKLPLVDLGETQDSGSPFGDEAGQQDEETGETMLAQSLSQEGAMIGPKPNPETILAMIVGHILRVGQKFEELRDIDMNDPEGSVLFVLQAYEELAAKKQKKKKSKLGKTEKGDPDFWKKQFEQKAKEAATLSFKVEALEQDKRTLKYQKEELKKDMRTLREKKDGEVSQANAKLKAKKEELEAAIRGHNTYNKEQRKNHQAAVDKVKADTAGAVQRANDTAFAARIVQERSHKDEIERVKNEAGRQIANAQAECNRRLAEHRSQFEGEAQRLRKEKEEQEVKAEEERTRLENKAAAEKIEILRREQALQGALLNREHFKGLADSALVSKFSSLSVKLEGISNIEWDNGLQPTWPYTEVELQRLSRNTRKLKQQMVLNTLWFALNELIFATPFRILGEDGKGLDEGWFDEFEGSMPSLEGPRWPHPTEQSERSRYEMAKSCLMAVQNKGDMNAQQISRRESYNDSVRRIVEDVSGIIGKVAPVDVADQQRLDDLVGTAGILWLEVCSQRYRLRVVLPSESEDVMMRDANDCRPIKLVFKPGLMRFGNSQGQELTREEYVGSWKGQTVEYQPM